MLGDERGVPTPIGDVTRTKGHVYKLIARRQTRDDRMHTLAILTCTAKTCAKNGRMACVWAEEPCVGRRALCGQKSPVWAEEPCVGRESVGGSRASARGGGRNIERHIYVSWLGISQTHDGALPSLRDFAGC